MHHISLIQQQLRPMSIIICYIYNHWLRNKTRNITYYYLQKVYPCKFSLYTCIVAILNSADLNTPEISNAIRLPRGCDSCSLFPFKHVEGERDIFVFCSAIHLLLEAFLSSCLITSLRGSK